MGRANKMKITNVTKMLLSGASGQAVTASGWTHGASGCLVLEENITQAQAVIPIQGLAVGDDLVSFRVVGSLGAGTSMSTELDVQLVKVTKGAGSCASTQVAAMTTSSVCVDTTLDVETVLSSEERVADDYQYYFLLNGTTYNDAANDILIAGIELDVRKTFGKTS